MMKSFEPYKGVFGWLPPQECSPSTANDQFQTDGFFDFI